ncbi:hypothetical protein [Actinocorallia lasiicapitis]
MEAFDRESDPAVADLLGQTLRELAPHDPSRHLDVLLWTRGSHVRQAAVADHALDGDREGRLALARSLLDDREAEQRLAGLLVAARVMSRWRSAVAALLPTVAGFIDDPSPDHRVLALRILDMCGAAARPWAGQAAAHLTPDSEPDRLARHYALMALSRTGDERALPHLAALLTNGHDGFTVDLPNGERGREANEPNLAEALAPFASHTGVLLEPLLARIRATPPADRDAYYKIINRWQDDGADPVRLARALIKVTQRPTEVLKPISQLAEQRRRRGQDDIELLLLAAEMPKPSVRPSYAHGWALSAAAAARVSSGNHNDALRLLRALWDSGADIYLNMTTPVLADLLPLCPPPALLAALKLLGDIAAVAPEAVAPAYPFLRAVTATDERPRGPWSTTPPRTPQWRAILDDDALNTAIRTIPQPLTRTEEERFRRFCQMRRLKPCFECQNIPDMVMDFWKPDKARRSLRRTLHTTMNPSFIYRESCCHDPLPAILVLPFLVEAALDPTAPDRPFTLQTIGELAVQINSRCTDAAWDDTFTNAVRDLLPLLEDADHAHHVAAILSHASRTARGNLSDVLLELLLARFPTYRHVSDAEMVLTIGRLAEYSGWRDNAVTWLRHLLDGTPDPEPDISLSTEAWLAWDERHLDTEHLIQDLDDLPHDVTLTPSELAALRQALPELDDPH